MSGIIGECFIVSKPHTKLGQIIFGRNALSSSGEVAEVLYFPASSTSILKCTNIEIDKEILSSSIYAVILSRSGKVWGAESGSNEHSICIGIVWTENEIENGLLSTDIVRLTLEHSKSTDEAITNITKLIERYGRDEYLENSSKYNFVICDKNSFYILNIIGKLWVAECVTEGYRKIPLGFCVGTKIDKSSNNLHGKLRELGLWDGNGDLNFCNLFSNNSNDFWPKNYANLMDDGTFNVSEMFRLLRQNDDTKRKTSHVSVLCDTNDCQSCHWFTGTENPCESVFKPFIFTSGSRISPLTKISNLDQSMTLLQKLHSQRKWNVVGNLLQTLECNCVDEINIFLSKSNSTDNELDELMKDCVEAEVKFYR